MFNEYYDTMRLALKHDRGYEPSHEEIIAEIQKIIDRHKENEK